MMLFRIKSAWDRFWYGEVSAIRPYLLMKFVLLIVAFDCWVLHVRRGWHYGLDGFNVAHFNLLDVLQPLPSPELYVVLMILTGILAFISAFTRPHRGLLAITTLMYTYGWMMSRIDSYQHHYLISLILFAIVFMPKLHVSDLYPPTVSGKCHGSAKHARNLSSWAYVLLGVNMAIVYLFTAVAKTDNDWLSGNVLRSMSFIQEPLSSVEFKLAYLGISLDLFWKAVAISVMTGEIVLSASYLISVNRDREKKLFYAITGWVGLLLAAGFHLGLELFDFRIGWFSLYMVVIACVYFLPRSLLFKAGSVITLPERKIRDLLKKSADKRTVITGSVTTGIAILLNASLCIYAGYGLDLPGAVEAGYIGAVLLVISLSYLLFNKQYRNALQYSLVITLSVILMWGAIALSETRFRYYSGLGVYNLRTNELGAALENLEKANIYEREENREKQRMRERLVEQLKRRLNR